MIETQAYFNTNGSAIGLSLQSDNTVESKIQHLYQSCRSSAKLHQLAGVLRRHTPDLTDLETSLKGHKILGQSFTGIRSVEVENIRGSESRTEDFDRHFYPLQEHTRSRWISVARAAVKGESLPPVELIQVGNTYFVRDGHHLISVALALGQKAVEAEVTVLVVE